MDKASRITKKLIAVTQQWLRDNHISCEDESHVYSQLIFNPFKSIRIAHQNKSYIVTPRFCLFLKGKSHELPKTEARDNQIFIVSGKNLRSLNEGMVDMSPLLRELLKYAMDLGHLRSDNKEHVTVYRLLTYQLMKSKDAGLTVPVPKEARLLKLYHLLMKDKLFDTSLDDLAKQAGASSRTIERLIQSELDMKFTDWRKLMRTQLAIVLLSQGRSVTDVAIEVGYKSASSFINAFKEQMGTSPKQFSKK